MNEILIAEICHEVNRAYCRSIGDYTQVSWTAAPEWQKQSAVNGVRLHLNEPKAGPAASHESWMKEKLETGWRYGPEKDETLKTHPCMIPFNELPTEQKSKDYIFAAIVQQLKGC